MGKDDRQGLVHWYAARRALERGDGEDLANALGEVLAKQTNCDGKVAFITLLADMLSQKNTEFGLVLNFDRHPDVANKRETKSHVLKQEAKMIKHGHALEQAGYDKKGQKKRIIGNLANELRVSVTTLKTHWKFYITYREKTRAEQVKHLQDCYANRATNKFSSARTTMQKARRMKNEEVGLLKVKASTDYIHGMVDSAFYFHREGIQARRLSKETDLDTLRNNIPSGLH